jgi:hypothetical protein
VDAAAVLAALHARGVTVMRVGGRLRVRPASRLTDELRAALRANKPALLARLTDQPAAFEVRSATPWQHGGRPCPRCQQPTSIAAACWRCQGRWCQGCTDAWLPNPYRVECDACCAARLAARELEKIA